MAGSSDGGAHLVSFVGADYTTRLLTEWVPNALSLEEAVARLTIDAGDGRTASPTAASSARAPPPTWCCSTRPACAPDAPRWCATSPPTARASSSTPRATRAVIVNGEVLLENGDHTGALPGQL